MSSEHFTLLYWEVSQRAFSFVGVVIYAVRGTVHTWFPVRRTMYMYDLPNKRQSECVSQDQEQQMSSFHGVNSGIVLEITPVVNS